MVPLAVIMYGVGVLVYRLLMRRVQRGEIFTQIFATVGLFFFIQNGVVALFTSDYRFIEKSFLTGLSGANLTIGGLRIGIPLLVGGLIALALFLLLYLLIDRTDFGLALQATSEDREAAMLVGIRPQRMYAVAWGLGSALVAVAGVILANFFAVFPQAGLPFTVLAYAIVALGGFGSILGTLMAALVVGVVQSVTAAYLPPAFKDAFVFGSYILIGLFRPQGLFGRF
jgi:branched-chain amino acid transport system permease protein